jgi:ubiquinone/menaquinone biosynthesis C-methylase UbiE
MDTQLTGIRDQQKASWNKFAAGWRKWDPVNMPFVRPAAEEIIRRVAPAEGDVVLDIASGTGEPGLSIAPMVGHGRVILTDLAEDMLSFAREKAVGLGLSNVDVQVCDVSELPFADNTFDIVTCRFGFMFFPSMRQAAQEIVRVLKPGGRVATSVWNTPDKNFWVTAIMGTIARNMEVSSPPPGSPGMFRCAADGLMTDLFTQTGLRDVRVTEVAQTLDVKTVDTYWEMMTEVGAPIVAALSKADEATHAKIKAEVFALVRERYPHEVRIAASSLVISGIK